jgi:alkylation response protein AidB-like acyl-CoA dehydrogenase
VDFGLTVEQKVPIQRADRLVKERIAPRAVHYDLALEAPAEDIQDLHREGWLLANLERKRGGLGYGLYGDDPLSFFLLDEHLAYGNPSTAHCFQVHNNALMMIAQIGTVEQVARWIQPTVETRSGEVISFLSSSLLYLAGPSSFIASRANEKSRTSSSGRFFSPTRAIIASISRSVMMPSLLSVFSSPS